MNTIPVSSDAAPHSPSRKISPEMVEVGVRVLRESGLLEHEVSVDYLVVRRILEEIFALQEASAVKEG